MGVRHPGSGEGWPGALPALSPSSLATRLSLWGPESGGVSGYKQSSQVRSAQAVGVGEVPSQQAWPAFLSRCK